MNNRYCVYFHIHPLHKHVFYVGMGTKKRPRDKTQRSRWWNRVTNKYGFIVEVIAFDLNRNDAAKMEMFYIEKFGRKDLGEGKLINMTNGGDGGLGLVASKATREKMSIAHLGKKQNPEWSEKIGASKRGKQRSNDLKAKLSIHFSKNPSTPKKSVDLLDMEGNFIKTFVGIKAAARELKIDGAAITHCCNGRFKSTKNMKWRFSNINYKSAMTA